MAFPSLEDFFLIHGQMVRQPRVLLPFHIRIIEALTQLVLGTLPGGKQNLMILMPPRHGKTFLVRDFITWSIGIFPDSEYLYISYGDDLSVGSTTAIKVALEQDWYNYIFPDTALTKWRGDYFTTAQGGAVYGTTVEGLVTGFGAGKKRFGDNEGIFGGALVIEDPLKAKEARSETTKATLLETYDSTIRNRKNSDNTPIILIQQRLAPDDLPGHILETEADKCHVLRFQGLSPGNIALWPQVRSVDSYLRLQKVNPNIFYTQEQQEPQNAGGNIIKKEWWAYYDCVNQDYEVNGLVFLTADTAMKEETMNDFTALQAWSCHEEHGKMYLDLIDEVSGKFEFPELLRRAKEFWNSMAKYGASRFYIEDKVSGTSLQQMMKAQGMPVYLWKPQDYEFPLDKVGRAELTTWYVEAGRIRLPAHNEELCKHIVEQCAAFNGKGSGHDDSVDALTMACSIWKSKGGGADVQTE